MQSLGIVPHVGFDWLNRRWERGGYRKTLIPSLVSDRENPKSDTYSAIAYLYDTLIGWHF